MYNESYQQYLRIRIVQSIVWRRHGWNTTYKIGSKDCSFWPFVSVGVYIPTSKDHIIVGSIKSELSTWRIISFFVIFVYLYSEYETLSVSISSFDHRAILMCSSAGSKDAE